MPPQPMNHFTCPICYHQFPRKNNELGLRYFAGKHCPECGHTATNEEVEKASRAAARCELAKSIDI